MPHLTGPAQGLVRSRLTAHAIHPHPALRATLSRRERDPFRQHLILKCPNSSPLLEKLCQGLRSFHSLNPWLFSLHAFGVESDRQPPCYTHRFLWNSTTKKSSSATPAWRRAAHSLRSS